LLTLRDAALGYSAGAVLAALLAVVITLMPVMARVVLSGAIAIRTIPLVALTPLLITFSGDGIRLVIVVGATATFFPSLVYLATGLRSLAPGLVDVLTGAGAGSLTILRKARLQACIPLVFASAKIAVPTAVTGALLAEWFGTGQGLGYLFATGVGELEFTMVWTGIALVTAASVIVYSCFEALEHASYRRFGG
jgi:ABC-type nitrate/sulfonate/bicarbonate transport system permease component